MMFFFFLLWCVVFITRVAISPQVENSHVICAMSQNWTPVILKCCFCSLTLVFVDCRAATFVWLQSHRVVSVGEVLRSICGGFFSLLLLSQYFTQLHHNRSRWKGSDVGFLATLNSVEQPDKRTGWISLEPWFSSIADAVYSSAAAHLWRSRTGIGCSSMLRTVWLWAHWVAVYAANPLCKMFFMWKLDPLHRSFQFGPIKNSFVLFSWWNQRVLCFLWLLRNWIPVVLVFFTARLLAQYGCANFSPVMFVDNLDLNIFQGSSVCICA